MTLSNGDQNVVANLRYRYGGEIAEFTDEDIARAWRFFSQSDEYTGHPESNVLIEWCQMAKDGRLK